MRRRVQEATAIKNKKGFIELKSQTNGVHFTTKQLKSLNDDYRDLSKAYDKKQSGLVKDVIQIAGASGGPALLLCLLTIPARVCGR